MLCTVLRAQSSWQVISSPNADYVTGTSKLLITGPDNIPVQNFADGTIQASFLQFPDTTFTLTLSTKTVGVSWPNWSSPPDSESSTPRCLFFPYNDNYAGSFFICFSRPLQTFGLEIQLQDPTITNNVTAKFYKGRLLVGSVTRTIGGASSARLLAAHSDTTFFDSIQIQGPSSQPVTGYAVAEIRYAVAPPPPPQPGPGTALSFSGNYVQTPVINLSASNALTIECWVQPGYIGWVHDIIRQMGSGAPDWLLEITGGNTLAFGLSSDSGYQELHVPIDSATYANGSWYHLAAVYNGTTQQLYRDGLLIGSTNKTGRLAFSSSKSAIGAAVPPSGAYTFPFYGGIDEFRVWSVARSAAEINQTLHASLAGTEPGLQAYWRFDEGFGSTHAYDSSGHGRTGTLGGSPQPPQWIDSGALLGQPILLTLPASDVTTNSATLHGRLALYGLGASAWFEWGDVAPTNLTPAQSYGDVFGTNAISTVLSSLLPSTSYMFRLAASNSAGIPHGNLVQFITPGPPAVTTLEPTSISSTSAVLQGTINCYGFDTAVWFEWGTNVTYGVRTPVLNVGAGFASIGVTQQLVNLQPGWQYDYRLVASNTLGTFAGTNQAFSTPLFSVSFLDSRSVGNTAAFAWYDYDRDGDLDLLMVTGMGTNASTSLFRNDPGTWNVIASTTGYGGGSAGLPNLQFGTGAWGDYDNDGAPDLLLTGYPEWSYTYDPTAHVFHNDHGLFTNAVPGLPVISRGAAAWGDYDNDGYLDFILAGNAADYQWDLAPTNTLYHNNRDGSFTKVPLDLPAVLDCSIAWGDYDNDGLLDFIMMGDTGSGPITRIYHNTNNTFTDIGAVLPGVASGSVAWGDFDGDGWLDILIAGSTNGSAAGAVCIVYRNNHNGTFTDIGANLPGVYKGSAAWGDCDNDGQLDILLTGIPDTFGAPSARIYHNNHGAFTDLGAGLPLTTIGAGVWGDFDGDGKLDVALIGTSGEWYMPLTTRIYRSFLTASNTVPNVPTAPTNFAALVSNNSISLSWSTGTDPQTPVPGLTYNVRVGTTPGGGQLVASQNDPVTGQSRLPQMGNAQHRLFALVTNVPVGNYYWSVQTINNRFAASPWATEATFSVSNGPPIVSTLPASNVVCCSAVLNGLVTPGASPTKTWFEWGTNLDFSNSTPPRDLVAGLVPRAVLEPIQNLQPTTGYQFRLVASNAFGVVAATNQVFLTEGPAPSTATLGASNVLYDSALLLCIPLSNVPADYFIEWGLTTNYGHTAPAAVLGAALHFDGLDDLVEMGWGRFADITNNFTIELWAKPESSRVPTAESTSGFAGTSGQRYALFPEEGGIGYGNAIHAGAGLSIGTNGVSVMEHSDTYLPSVLVYSNGLSGWTHIALVYSNHVPQLYMNGILARTGLTSPKMVHPSVDLGQTTNQAGLNYGYFAGAIQEIRLWDIPLAAATIQTWMDLDLSTNHPNYSHLQGYWPLNEGRGTTAFDQTWRTNSGQLLHGATWIGGRRSSNTVYAALIEGLTDATTYHFRALAINPGGISHGDDMTFTTRALPPQLSLSVQSNRAYLLRFSGSSGTTYVIEASTNLLVWADLSNLPKNLFEFLDLTATNLPVRFYRVRVP